MSGSLNTWDFTGENTPMKILEQINEKIDHSGGVHHFKSCCIIDNYSNHDAYYEIFFDYGIFVLIFFGLCFLSTIFFYLIFKINGGTESFKMAIKRSWIRWIMIFVIMCGSILYLNIY